MAWKHSTLAGRLARLVAVLAAIGFLTATLLGLGLLPRDSVVVEVETPLYPRTAMHSVFYSIDLGRGVYSVVFRSEANTSITVACGFPYNVTSGNAGPGGVFRAEIYCRSGITVSLQAILKPFQDSMGVLEVDRKWASSEPS